MGSHSLEQPTTSLIPDFPPVSSLSPHAFPTALTHMALKPFDYEHEHHSLRRIEHERVKALE
jgi:hypothetical protein